MDLNLVCLAVLAVVALALALAGRNYASIRKKKKHYSPEEDDMLSLAITIRSGAKTFMMTEYKTIIIVVLIVAAIFSLFIEQYSGFTFLLGACMSSAACIIGMAGATRYRLCRFFAAPKESFEFLCFFKRKMQALSRIVSVERRGVSYGDQHEGVWSL